MSLDFEPEGRLYIDGQFREAAGGGRFEVINPADETVVGTAADGQAEDVAAAVTAARRAADETSWATDHAFRQRVLRQLQDALAKEAAALKAVQIAEAGTPASNIGAHIDVMTGDMSYFNDLIGRFPWETDFGVHEGVMGLPSNRHVRYEPYGVVGAITPWNAPFMTDLWKIHHALSTGNTVVLKTAPDTPLTGSLLARIAHEHTDIPAGVLNILSSEDKAAAGEALTGDPRVDMYHFTGSPAVGQRIYERGAVGIRKVCLELGGKSANIILDDADLAVALPLAVGMCMSNSGQGCALATRLVVHASRYDEVVEGLTEALRHLPWGDPTDPTNVVGPIINAAQLARMEGMVDRAREAGARTTVGGRRGASPTNGRGFWYEPTLVADVHEDAEIAQLEVFGPVLTVVKYDGDDDEAVRVANNSRYGLSAYVQTQDPERAWRVANRLKAGTVNIGPSFYLSPDTPFGGYGISGVGREHGEDGFREYLQAKTIASPGVAGGAGAKGAQA
ncbi:NAD-dependent aldehyde dehydrogenase [Frankia canadensis]|uniref:NAD-dependent aldehyde dehydrogenase n=1 Tax=Frankia canadensis TaxID=1836972 RepID=A0A2I2L2T9_9ACTN|nr:aldehyde dehydrogenase family protein [Frankia canadensis]SNQ52243.1 NAD-dependent aldehyde dehydrogenase [Frankia canadensis]SOU59533.1 NAD-dependent aldehyde dehydrogenase [Frankia canadensis]